MEEALVLIFNSHASTDILRDVIPQGNKANHQLTWAGLLWIVSYLKCFGVFISINVSQLWCITGNDDWVVGWSCIISGLHIWNTYHVCWMWTYIHMHYYIDIICKVQWTSFLFFAFKWHSTLYTLVYGALDSYQLIFRIGTLISHLTVHVMFETTEH